MNLIHSLLDTKRKREIVFCLVAFALLLIEMFYNSVFLWQVSRIDKLEALYDLIDIARKGSIGNILLGFFEAPKLELASILVSMIRHTSIRFVWIVLFFSSLLFVKAKKMPILKVIKPLAVVVCIMQFVAFLFMVVFVGLNVKYATYGTVLIQVKWLSAVLLGGHGATGLLAVAALIYLGYQMICAMEYRAVEFIEEVSIDFQVAEEVEQ